MRNNEPSSKVAAIIFSFIVIVLPLTFVSYFVFTPSDKLVKEDTEYLYIKEYKLWGTDSCTYRYHKPIVHDGVITNIETRTYIMGVIGKGGHWQTDTNITILFDGKTYKDTYTEWGTSSTVKYKKGNKVKVKEIFYPHYVVKYY